MYKCEQILRYHFTLVHVPGKLHGPDGLSRRPWAEGDPEYPHDEDDDIEIADEGLKGVEYPYGDQYLPKAFEDFKHEIDTRGGYYVSIAEENGFELTESYEDISLECFKAEQEELMYQKAKEKRLANYFIDKGCEETVAVLKVEELMLPREEERYDEDIQRDYPEQSPQAKEIEQKITLVKQYIKKETDLPMRLLVKDKDETFLKDLGPKQRAKFKKYCSKY